MHPEIEKRYLAFAQSKKLRQTSQRDAIVEEVFRTDEHFNAEELMDRMKKTGIHPSRATVYRTLSLLTEANLLKEIDLGDELTTYDPNFLDRPSHNHLVCVDCSKVIEFEDDHLETLNECLSKRLGFQAVSQTLRIEACCDKLRLQGRCENLIAARLSGKKLKKRR